jgi:hypothetical protein
MSSDVTNNNLQVRLLRSQARESLVGEIGRNGRRAESTAGENKNGGHGHTHGCVRDCDDTNLVIH